MSILHSLFGKKTQKPAGVINRPPSGPSKGPEAPRLALACRSLPFQSSLAVSPGGDQVCFISPEGSVIACEPASDHPLWTLPVSSSRNSACAFVGERRLLVLSPLKPDEPLFPRIQLVDASNGRVIAEASGPKLSTRQYDSDPQAGLFVSSDIYDLVTIQIAGDRIEISTLECGQMETAGPRIGPDGKIYLFPVFRGLHRVEGGGLVPISPGCNCIHFEPPSRVFCGGGHYDRSGPSALHMADLAGGAGASFPFGVEPVYQVFPGGGGDRLLLASCSGGSLSRRDPTVVTLFSLAEKAGAWSLTIDDLPQGAHIYHSLLASAPQEGWALLQSGRELRQVSLEDGHTLAAIEKQAQQWTWARWLPSRRLLYLGGNPFKEGAGLLDCYRL